MNRRRLLQCLAIATLTPRALDLRAAEKTWRIGYLATASPAANAAPIAAFLAQLRDLGYVEGRNLALEYRWTVDDAAGVPPLAAQLVAARVDAILAWTTPVVIAARKATDTIPIVMVGVADPVGSGLVSSLAHPGGNVTGITNLSAELSSKVVEILVQLVPRLKHFTGVRNALNPASALQSRQTEEAAKKLGLQYDGIGIRTPDDLDTAFAAMAKARSGAAVFFADGLFVSQRERIVSLARRYRIPTAFSRRENVEAGGLFAYGANLSGQFAQAAVYLDRIFKGAKPADLPIEQPTKLELVVNQGAARALRLTVPNDLLLRADEVIR